MVAKPDMEDTREATLVSSSGGSGFLPGIAERLGNPTFTRSLALRAFALVRFILVPAQGASDRHDQRS